MAATGPAVADVMIAATALEHALTVVSRKRPPLHANRRIGARNTARPFSYSSA
jgi:predicted nucleic acid-binding protein